MNKILLKKLLGLIIFLFPMTVGIVFATDYLFYADACPHCDQIVEFVKENNLQEQFDLELKEVRQHKENLKLFKKYLDKNHLDAESTYVPFLAIDDGESCDYME